MESITPYRVKKFTCPLCNTFASQSWYPARVEFNEYGRRGYENASDIVLAFCHACEDFSIWKDQKMVFPDNLPVDPPNEDLSEEIIADYEEAASILNKSPRGSAALLRLAIQKLCHDLGCNPSKSIDNNIAELVKKGLHPKVQKALDIVRVTGNEAVHPGQIDLSDDIETAKKIFELVNIIARQMITEEKDIDSIYESLPNEKREAIEKRDN
ncbi:hypothetical protein COU76_05985 [Candidatus Peregrinibacteria bacterium CG10_big_fil_rev_8_21_14_0_10_49_10]|nr:MAG: hypothetical protein COU76_05985 [Candidatus Peregrinibacteria bacterium CG10_big_fil_rev_8_21_14_0_10_49_10]